jgi:hypothetical protein
MRPQAVRWHLGKPKNIWVLQVIRSFVLGAAERFAGRTINRMVQVSSGWLAMRRVCFLIVAILVFSGCAVRPVATIQTNDSLRIALSGAKKGSFKMLDSTGNLIAEDGGEDGELEFRVPGSKNVRGCVYIEDENGKKLGKEKYELFLIDKFRQVDGRKKNLENVHDIKSKQYSVLDKNYQDIKIRMEGHAAFSDGRCHLPESRPLPPEPVTRCSSYDECLEEGAAICYSRFIGAEGCALALKEVKVSGLLASPSCAAIAAKIAGDKYDMGDAVIDVIRGAADDYSDRLINSNSWLDKIGGVLVKIANSGYGLYEARLCTNNFVQRHYGPKIVWQQTVDEITQEPQSIKSNCESLIVQHNRYVKKMDEINIGLQSLRVELADVNVIHRELAGRQVTNTFCEGLSSNVLGDDGFANRYLIGVELESGHAVNMKDQWVQVKTLIKDFPAQYAGVQVDDRIVSVNGRPVSDILELTKEIQDSGGGEILLKIYRNNSAHRIKVVPVAKRVRLSD